MAWASEMAWTSASASYWAMHWELERLTHMSLAGRDWGCWVAHVGTSCTLLHPGCLGSTCLRTRCSHWPQRQTHRSPQRSSCMLKLSPGNTCRQSRWRRLCCLALQRCTRWCTAGTWTGPRRWISSQLRIGHTWFECVGTSIGTGRLGTLGMRCRHSMSTIPPGCRF